jgi:hypothetical protein
VRDPWGIIAWGAGCKLWRLNTDSWGSDVGSGQPLDFSRALWEGVGATLRRNNHGPLVGVSSLEDETQQRFWVAMGGNEAEFSARLLRTFETTPSTTALSDNTVGLDTSFMFEGGAHCSLSMSSPFALAERATAFDPWLASVFASAAQQGQTQPSVSLAPDPLWCSGCTLASVSGCDGVNGTAAGAGVTGVGLEDDCGVCLSLVENKSRSTCVNGIPPWLEDLCAETPAPSVSSKPTPSPTWGLRSTNHKKSVGVWETLAQVMKSALNGSSGELWLVVLCFGTYLALCWRLGRREKSAWVRLAQSEKKKASPQVMESESVGTRTQHPFSPIVFNEYLGSGSAAVTLGDEGDEAPTHEEDSDRFEENVTDGLDSCSSFEEDAPGRRARNMSTLVLGFARAAHTWPLWIITFTILPSVWLGYSAYKRNPVDFDLNFDAYLSSDGTGSPPKTNN